MLIPSAIDRVGLLRAPDRTPRCQPQARSALAGELAAADEAAGQFLPGRQAGVFDQRAGGDEPARVAALREDGGGADRGDAGDRGDQLGQSDTYVWRGLVRLGLAVDGQVVAVRVR